VSSKEYSIRLYRPGDEEEIVEILKISFPEWRDAESPHDHWRWKYLDNPYGSDIMVADWDGKIVGVQHKQNLGIKIDEKIISSYADDEAVHPDYRRKGIFKNMLNYAEEHLKKKKIAFNFGISIHEATLKISLREGYTLFPFSFSHMIQIFDVKTHFRMRPTKNNLIAIYGFSLLKLLNRIKNIVKETKITSEITIKDVSEFDERFNTFWQNTKNGYNFIIEKNWEYLNWRYCDPRSNLKGRYFIKQAEQDGEILGFIVLEVREKDDYSEGYVMDLLALPDRRDVVRRFVEEATMFFRESDINVVHYRVVKNHFYQALFNEQGFIATPSKIYLSLKFFFNKEKMKIIKNSQPSQIHFNYGDYY
jgi:GNAT superfamily N-acetyltransferase